MLLFSQEINSTKDFSQSLIIDKLQEYIDCKREKITNNPRALKNCKLHKSINDGLCSGLVAYWLYFKYRKEEFVFKHQINKLLSWDSTKFKTSQLQIDEPFIEDFLNNTISLHAIKHILDDVNYYDIHTALNLILPKHERKIVPAEFSLTFVFNHELLTDFIFKNIPMNKMVRIGNGFHAVGIFHDQEGYTLYDPEDKMGSKKFDTPEYLATAIFMSYSYDCLNSTHLSLSFLFFDFEGKSPARYPDKKRFYNNLLADKDYKEYIFSEFNIFRLAVVFQDQTLLECLLTAGYVYRPWQTTVNTELEEAIYANNKTLLKLLSEQFIDPDYSTPEGITAVGRAIKCNAPHMLQTLLESGASTTLPINYTKMHTNKTIKPICPFDVAIDYNDFAAIELLVQYGLILTDYEIEIVQKTFSPEQAKTICKPLNRKTMTYKT